MFDDGHDTGLYSWTYLRELGENKEARWQDYLAELAAKRLTPLSLPLEVGLLPAFAGRRFSLYNMPSCPSVRT